MQKKMNFFVGGAMFLCALFLLTGCDQLMSKLDEPVSSYLAVSQNDVTIPTGDTYQIKVETINTENPITYESSDPTVATVDENGLVTSVADGEAVITVSVAGDAYYKEGTTQVKVAVKRPLTFEALEDGGYIYVAFNGDVEEPIYYTVNGGEKKAINGWFGFEVSKGDKVEFESANEGLGGNVRIYPYGAKCAVYGNVMSMISPDGNYHTNKAITQPNALARLLYGERKWYNEKQEYIYYTVSHDKYKLVLPATKLANSCYYYMLANTGITEAPELPATELANSCYYYMFYNCDNLTEAPELPATELADYCYCEMFYNCDNLTKAPELPATKLANGCYNYMFDYCVNLTEAPKLPATELAYNCYSGMFYGCAKLVKAPKLPATKLADYCYSYMLVNTGITEAPELPATKLANYCYNYMLANTGITKAPELPATELAYSCYYSMFYGCKSLTAAPELPAKSLATRCYYRMFYNCTKLSSVKCLAVTMGSSSIYQWLWNAGTDESVTTRTFTHAAENTEWVNSNASSSYRWYVPTGWTIQAAK